MLVKASIAATLVIGAVMSASSLDFRELYNEMYPVNGLKRDVLTVCHQAKPTFIRAIEADRVNCYDSMPDPVELAIGWVRTSSRLAALRKTPTAVETAERMLDQVLMQHRAGLASPVAFTGYLSGGAAAARPCPNDVKEITPVAASNNGSLAGSDEELAGRIARGDRTPLARLGLMPRDPRPGKKPQELPPIPLAGNGPPAAVQPAADPVASKGCRTPA